MGINIARRDDIEINATFCSDGENPIRITHMEDEKLHLRLV
jgi:hypothetical protein